jgi:hypothetical protein
MTPNNVRTFGGLRILTAEAHEVGACMLFYGAGGSAKTTVMAQIVEHKDGGPAALLDIDGSSSSVYHLIPKGLDIIPIPDWRSFMSVVRDFAKPGCVYQSLIVDNLSELAPMCLRNITTEAIPQIQHWGQMTSEMLRVVRMLRDISRFRSANVLFSAWEEVAKDEDAGYVRRTLNLTPKLAAALPGIVTMVGHLGTMNNPPDFTRTLTFTPSPKLDSKWRVAPTESAAKIPQVLYLRPGSNFLYDFLETVRHGAAFPVDKYAAPQRRNSSGGSSSS